MAAEPPPTRMARSGSLTLRMVGSFRILRVDRHNVIASGRMETTQIVATSGAGPIHRGAVIAHSGRSGY
jgi:hypothetical protein